MLGRKKKSSPEEAKATMAAAVAERELRGGAGPAQREVTRFDHGSRVPGWDDAVDRPHRSTPPRIGSSIPRLQIMSAT